MSSDPTIKTIIPVSTPTFAAYLPDIKNDIDSRIVPVVCFSLEEDSDSIDGQIVAGELIVEASYVGAEEGFGKFLGYYHATLDAERAIEAAVAMFAEQEEEEEEEEEEDAEDDENDDGEGDEEEDEEDDEEDEEDDDDDEGEDDDEDDEGE